MFATIDARVPRSNTGLAIETQAHMRRLFPSLDVCVQHSTEGKVDVIVPGFAAIENVHHARKADRAALAGRILRTAYPKGWAVA